MKMTEFAAKLKELDSDALADVAAAVKKEERRRAKDKPMSQMTTAEFDRHAAEMIGAADEERAKSRSSKEKKTDVR